MDSFYFSERERKRQRLILRLKIYGVLFVILGLAIGAAYLLIESRIFNVKNISVIEVKANGESMVSGMSLEDFKSNIILDLKNFYANQSRFSQILTADNILVWNPQNLPIAKSFLTKYAGIKELVFKKDLIKRNIEIDFEKRNRFGVWCRGIKSGDNSTSTLNQIESNQDSSSTVSKVSPPSHSDCWWFDDDGVIFAKAPYVEGNLIYKINDFTGRQLAFGDKILDDRLLANLFKIFAFLDKSGLSIKILKLENLALEEISTESPNSAPTIYFSLRFDPSSALAVLDSNEKNNLENAQYIDLRVENRVYYK